MRKRKKKVEKRKIVLIVLLVLCIILGYIANVVSTDRELTIFEKAIKDSVLVIQKVITYPIDLVIDIVDKNKEKNKMYNEYESLKEKLNEAEFYITENEELKKQINDLKEVLKLNTTLAEFESINATIIGRDLSYWNDNIIIDKGEEDGIYIDMPVIVAEGLIGKVVKTSNFNSTVRLLTSNNVNDKISVKINNGDKYTYGILSRYDEENDKYIIEGIAENMEIKEDSLVTTTGIGDIFPSGIVIGKVVGIGTDNFDLSSVLEVKSNVDFDAINYVTVLKRKDIW